jgi:hypothetical protein
MHWVASQRNARRAVLNYVSGLLAPDPHRDACTCLCVRLAGQIRGCGDRSQRGMISGGMRGVTAR